MPFNSSSDLPDNLKHVLPAHALDIYKEAFNNAYEEYKHPSDRRGDSDREETAHKVAWSAVKKSYEKGADDKWHPKR
jgi:cation transport regulator